MNKFRERKNKETHKAFEKKNEVVDLQKFNNEDSDARFTFSKRRRLKKSKFKQTARAFINDRCTSLVFESKF